ncbi:MAG: flagellar M-ring protein FliF [Lentisphaerae bacterium]|nr:flagellar M-ring protein FliF [Lentisphaerota bacterium]
MMQVLRVLGKQIKEIWSRFGFNQKASIILALMACVALLAVLVYWSTRPDFRLLWSGLTMTDAAAMREKLEDAKIQLELRDSGTAIYVSAKDVNRARLMLAGQGLPKETSAGLELFEHPQFGMTDFAQNITYQRALQGEIERNICVIGEIESARVTLTLAKEKLFSTAEDKPSGASIMLKVKRGAQLDPAQVRSIAHLTASSVPGLQVSGITIVDQTGKLLSAASAAGEDQLAMAGDQLGIQRNVEVQLTKNAQEILDTFLGKDRSVVKVAAELDFSRIEKRQEKYDKDGKVIRSEKIQTESSTKPGQATSGDGGTRGNTTIGNPNFTPEQSQSKTKKENVQNEYLVPVGVENTLQTGARIARISASVCVAKGAASRTPTQIQAIQELVEAAVGAVKDPVRGRRDVVKVEEMEFQAPGAAPAPKWWDKLPVPVDSLVRYGVLALLLVVVWLAGRRIMSSAASVQSAEIGVPIQSMGAGGAGGMIQEKEVDVDLYETLQSVKEDPKKAAAWITRSLQIS